MPRFPRPKSYLPQLPSTTPSRGESRFLDQVGNGCRLEHLSYRTEQSYVAWVRRFILFHNNRHPQNLGPTDVRAFLREAQERNDETLEHIYIGRRFKNDSEWLEKLFELYTQVTAEQATGESNVAKRAAGRNHK